MPVVACDMSALAIKQMSWDEKLRTMEELWVLLTQDESRLGSPLWHQDALRETAARYEAGQEQSLDWDATKRELRKRAEGKSKSCRRRSRIWTEGGGAGCPIIASGMKSVLYQADE